MPAGLVKKKFGAFTVASGFVISFYAGCISLLVWVSLAVGVVLSLLVTSFAEFGSAYPSVAGCVTLASELGGPEYGRVCAAGCGDSGADTSGRPLPHT
ncbi:hypothetical protein CPLU01_11801 [Colletotrichum plurivorum]|uniref:Uncharacterized protein n=1 Tax=Colletotrichum plurivorum TaxID=2175906 RepID=A0A8H6K1W1_9PEZI|nr:hypothetical protein CPLU01_11801 [Colletotrichum plurivorum]